jgi:hypothetical protein
MPHALLRRGAQGVSPFIGRQGLWQAAWLPPRLAAWPFDLVEVSGGQALALHETSDLLNDGPCGTPIFEDADVAALSPETAQMAALLKTHAEALLATIIAATALLDYGLLTPLDGQDHFLTIDPIATADLNEANLLALHRAGALGLLHAGLVALAHLPWMAKAEKRLAVVPGSRPHPLPARKRSVAGSSFLTALAADTSADEALFYFSGLSQT